MCLFQVTRWFPDHLAAQCYGCESRFWLATRKHHCRSVLRAVAMVIVCDIIGVWVE